jgi:hypothetical protein
MLPHSPRGEGEIIVDLVGYSWDMTLEAIAKPDFTVILNRI